MDFNIDMNDDWEDISGPQIQKAFEYIKEMIGWHFKNIREADTCFGADHAALLMQHIVQNTSVDVVGLLNPHLSGDAVQQVATSHITVNPWPGSFQLTANPSLTSDMGLFRILPLEIRGLIYDYVFAVVDPEDECMCNGRCRCTRSLKKAGSSIGLLQTCSAIYRECMPRLYEEEFFGMKVGYQKSTDDDELVEWFDPVFYVDLGVEQQIISYPPSNVLHLVRNLEIKFINDTLHYDTPDNWPFLECTKRYQNAIEQVCDTLKDCVQFQILDITLSFTCKYADITYMENLLEPFKMLRSIQDPHITVLGYQHREYSERMRGHLGFPSEPRWALNKHVTKTLEWIMRLPHGEPIPDDEEVDESFEAPLVWFKTRINDGSPHLDLLEVFRDENLYPSDDEELFFLSPPDKEPEPRHSCEYPEETTRAYLRDVYNTEDPNFLNGNMPPRWQRWLKKEILDAEREPLGP